MSYDYTWAVLLVMAGAVITYCAVLWRSLDAEGESK